MPIKYKKTESVRNRATGEVSQKHYYIKNAPLSTLQEIVENKNTAPKTRSKIQNEIVRREKIAQSRSTQQ